MRKIWTLALVATMAAGGVLGMVAGATPAQATNTCNGSNCYGLDPAQTYSSINGKRCDTDAYTPYTASQGLAASSTLDGYIELRYGPHCHANWAKITRAWQYTQFWVENKNAQRQTMWVPTGNTSSYSNMVNGYYAARAVIGDDGGATGWY